MVLVDTNVLLWMLHGNKRLSKKAAHAIDCKLPLYHSAASFWEIAIKFSGKGFDFEIDPDWNRIFPSPANVCFLGRIPQHLTNKVAVRKIVGFQAALIASS
jgi:PIN domain nuclease of toxin-antitoxin system